MTAAFDTGGNVARLDYKRAARHAAAGKPATRAQEIVEHCRRQLREQVHGALPGILHQVDDALFDLADKADSNQLQSVYFEAMRSLRLCREDLETRFLSALDDSMGERSSPGGASKGAPHRGGVALSLVDPEELEESVAVKNVAAKIRNLCREDLFALDRRVALLLSNPTLEGEDNPLAPEAICDAARAAVGVIDAGLEVRLLVLKLFDRHLTRVAERFYPELNTWLVREGVLPDVSAAVAPRPESPARRAPPATPAQPSGPPVGGTDPWTAGSDGAREESWEQFHAAAGGGASRGQATSAPVAEDGAAAADRDIRRGPWPATSPGPEEAAPSAARGGEWADTASRGGEWTGTAPHGAGGPDFATASSASGVDHAGEVPGAGSSGGNRAHAGAGADTVGAGGRGADAGSNAGATRGAGAANHRAPATGRHAITASRPAGASAGRAPVPTGGVAGGPRGEQVLGVLDEVMRVGGGIEAGEPAPGRERFLVSLTALQRAPAGTGTVGNVLRDLKGSGTASGVGHMDGLMIDVVAMMFDYILEDPNIGDGMRALIGRLQIPVLKVAILDKSFFARRSHPARSFVNALADLGARLHGGDPDHAPLLTRVRGLVKRILDDFDAELDVFAMALRELEAMLVQENENLKRGAWSSAHAAEARERLVRARRAAAERVSACLADGQAPAAVADFLREHWRHVLGERLFREGQEGVGWRAGVRTMEQLLWSVAPKTVSGERERLLSLLPALLGRLKAGMQELGVDDSVRAALLQALSALHIAALRGAAPAAEHAAKAPAPAAAAAAGAGRAGGAEAGVGQPAGTKTAGPAADPGRGDGTAAASTQAANVVQAKAASAARPAPGAHTAARLRAAVEHANALVWRTAEQQPQCEGMGATVVAVKLDGDALVCAHAGDSRLYRLRRGELAAMTEDHTYRRDAVARGLVSEEDAAQIAGNMITRAVGGDAAIAVEVNVHGTAPGDLYLCCSDGLSDMLDDAAIADLVRADPQSVDLDALAAELVAAANAAGGRDNVSVGLLRVDEALPEATDGAGPRGYGAFVRVAALTDPGRRRAHNEDSVEAHAAAGVLVLADGMGGHNAGEVASAMTVKVVLEALLDAPPVAETDTFDYAAIQAEFWAGQFTGDDTALDLGSGVEHIVLQGDDLDTCFDVDQDADTVPATEAAREAQRVARDAARDPLLRRVLELRSGTWVEFGERAGQGVRAHLSWVAPGGTRFLFTDRAGNKVSEATPHGLAVELRAGRLRVLDRAPLFERAVGDLTRRLRDAQQGPGPAATVH